MHIEGRCIECGDENVHLKSALESITVEGENIEVNVRYRQCLTCNADWANLEDGDPLETAYYIYRNKYGLLQPEEIKKIRKSYGLTQKELARLLGWGDVTICRYENGTLQSKAYDNMLRSIQKPSNLCDLLKRNPEIISRDKYDTLVKTITEMCEDVSYKYADAIQI